MPEGEKTLLELMQERAAAALEQGNSGVAELVQGIEHGGMAAYEATGSPTSGLLVAEVKKQGFVKGHDHTAGSVHP